MARLVSISKSRGFLISLNISFLILLFFFLGTYTHLSQPLTLQSPAPTSTIQSHDSSRASNDLSGGCKDLARYKEIESKCAYIKSDPACTSEGYIDYLQLFYCSCGHNQLIGYLLLVLWLVILFYLLANTAADYFCSSLEDLSRLLNLSPTISGASLLALGNGAPDVFASIVSFVGPGSTGEVGLNSILGGAFFVSSVVVGIIGILVGPRGVAVNKSGFVRDVCFLLLILVALLGILLVGRITIWGAIGFISIYFVYVFVVSSEQVCLKKDPDMDELKSPLIEKMNVEEITILVEREVTNDGTILPLFHSSSLVWSYGKCFLSVFEFPLYLPRRLTIPVVSDERWSKPYAVASVTFAPLLLAALWSGELGLEDKKIIFLVGCLAGIVLGVLSGVATKKSSPPKRFLFPWLAGGFLMSVVWTYIIAEELVALLVSLGGILGISPSILGLTVLAWGNSLGDLIANVAMALNGGSDGAQVAISGCYAGPIFNIMVGLGLSLLFSTWAIYPSSYVVPKDNSLYQTLSFLVGGLLWAVLILPKKEMKLDRVLGGGLLAIYLCFLSLNLAQTVGLVQQSGPT